MPSKSFRVTTVRRKFSYRPWMESIEDRLLLAVITVTSTGDAINPNDGKVTLREAITAANSNKNISDVVGVGAYGNDTIDFDIPGTGVQTIRPTSALPIITDPVTIDGYTQPGSAPNTNPVGQGLNGKLLIEIDGENAGDVRFGMIIIEAGNCTVRGLVINRTQGVKIGIDSYGPTIGNNQIEGNYIGTDATGTQDFAPDSDGSSGIVVQTQGNTIGGTTPAARNLISGNAAYGISDNAGVIPNVDSRVQGNLIGTDRTGTRALGNGSGGVAAAVFGPNMGRIFVGGPEAGAGNLISGNGGVGVTSRNGVVQDNFIGTDVTGTLPIGNAVGVAVSGNVQIEQNIIAFNAAAGVSVTDSVDSHGEPVPPAGDLITRNSIFMNSGPGIDVSTDDVTLGYTQNDSPDQDGIQNYPIIDSVAVSGTGTRVVGMIESKPSSNFRLEFFAGAAREGDTVFGEGRSFLGSFDVTTVGNGLANFTVNLPALPAERPYVTATATDISDDGSGPRNNTSEFSPVAVVGGPTFVVTNTNDSGLGSLREAIINANVTPGAQTITFAIPATDPRHFYYRNDGIAGQVTTADIATTTAANDTTIADIDPDWPSSWYSIAPDHSLPEIVDTTVIDGYSQPGSRQNTLPTLRALDTVLRVELDGTNAPGTGLNLGFFNASIDAGGSRIDGLAINSFSGDGIRVSTLNGGVVIAGSFIGTDVSGTKDLGNNGSGIYQSFEDNATIGGTSAAEFNLISGNDTDGIELLEPLGVNITGNLLGLDRNVAFALPNGGPSILFTTNPRESESTSESHATNTASPSFTARSNDIHSYTNYVHFDLSIGFNPFDGFLNGVLLGALAFIGRLPSRPTAASAVIEDFSWIALSLLAGPSHSTQSLRPQATQDILAIDYDEDGVTPNDPGDADTGSNGPQNYPVLTSATTATATTVTGTLNSLASTSFRIELYSNTLGANYRAGEQSLGTVDVTTDAHGNASFTFPSPVRVPVGQFITALATRLETGTLTPVETSEFSASIPVTAGVTQPTANLSVSQSATPNPVAAGSDLTFTVTVSSAGPGPATGVRLVVTPPAGATFVSATGGVMPVGGTLTFNLGAIGNGSSSGVTIVIRPATPGSFVSRAVVSANEADPATADNTSTLTVTALDSASPTVVKVLAASTKAKATPIVLTFSEDLDHTRAALLANYRLVMAGRDKKFGTKDDKTITLRSVTYNVATRAVTLIPRKKLALGVKYRITVDGTSAHGIDDLAGNLLDGNRDGRASGNFVQIIKLTRSKA